MKRKPVDLSFIYGDADLDRAQSNFDRLPSELKDHLWKAFAHAAKLGPNPGFYRGPRPQPPDEE